MPELLDLPQTHQAGGENRAALMSSLLRWSGLEISTAYSFGLGSGYTFSYWHDHSRRLISPNWTTVTFASLYNETLLTDLCRSLGLGIRTTKSMLWDKVWQKAWNAVPKLLEQGRPGLLTVRYPAYRDLIGLPLSGAVEAADWLDFKLWVVNHDPANELLTILDGERENSQVVTIADLKRLWGQGSWLGAEYCWNDFVLPVEMYNLRYATQYALAKSARRMWVPSSYEEMVGLKALQRFLRDVQMGALETVGAEWTVTFSGLRQGDPGFRYTFATFLCEAARVLQEPDLEHLGALARACGDHWQTILVNLDQGTQPSTPLLHGLGELESELTGRLWGLVRGWEI